MPYLNLTRQGGQLISSRAYTYLAYSSIYIFLTSHRTCPLNYVFKRQSYFIFTSNCRFILSFCLHSLFKILGLLSKKYASTPASSQPESTPSNTTPAPQSYYNPAAQPNTRYVTYKVTAK